jgi:tetratricopeptide (TPR) repeat protein
MSWFAESAEQLMALGVGYAMKGQALNFFNRGKAYFMEGQRDRAISNFDEAIRLNPQKADYFLWRGKAYKENGDYDRAIADYDEAVRLDPKDADHFEERGTAYRRKGQFDRAIADFDELVRLQPSAINFWRRGDAYDAKGERERAIADFRKAKELDDHMDRDAFLCGLRDWEKDHDYAIAAFDRAIQLNPEFAEAFYNRGFAHMAKGNHDQAIADYSEAIRIDSTGPRRYDLARRYGWMPLHKAQFYYLTDEVVPDNDEANADLFFRAGVYQEKRFEYDSAIKFYTAATKLDPEKNADAFFRRGLLYQKKTGVVLLSFDKAGENENEAAISDLNEAIRLDPENAEYLYERSSMHADVSRRLRDIDQAEHLPSYRADYLFARGDAYAAKAEVERAVSDYDEAIQLHPKLILAIKAREDVLGTSRR